MIKVVFNQTSFIADMLLIACQLMLTSHPPPHILCCKLSQSFNSYLDVVLLFTVRGLSVKAVINSFNNQNTTLKTCFSLYFVQS